LNEFRKGFIRRAFKKLDKDGNGTLEIADIKGVYNAKKHPDVINGKKTEDDVLLEFLETFETHHNILMGKASDHMVSMEEFEEYYKNVSCSIDRDDYFALMMKNTWKLDEADKTYSKGWKADEDTKAATKPAPVFSSPNRKAAANQSSAENTLNAPIQDAPPEDRPATADPRNKKSVDRALELFRQKLASRGARGILGMARQFKVNPKQYIKACIDHG